MKAHYYPIDGQVPELDREVVLQHAHFPPEGIGGIVEGTEHSDRTDRVRIWLREGDGQAHRYDLHSVSWAYVDQSVRTDGIPCGCTSIANHEYHCLWRFW